MMFFNPLRLLLSIYYNLLALLILFCYPVQIFSSETKKTVLVILLSVVLFLAFILARRLFHVTQRMCLSFLFGGFIIFTVSLIGGGLYIAGTLMVFCLAALSETNHKIKIYESLLNIYCALMFLGLVLLFFKMLGFINPVGQLLHASELKNGIVYNNYFYFLLVSNDGVSDLFRFMSIYDEPGVVGTLSGLFMISFYQKRFSIRLGILLVSGIASLSTAFFVFFIVYIALQSWAVKQRLLFFLVISVTAIIVFLPDSDLLVLKLIDKVMVLNNRTDACFMEKFSNDFGGHFMFGHGIGAASSLLCDASSVLVVVYDIGVSGVLLMYLFILLWIFLVQKLYLEGSFGRISNWFYFIWPLIFIMNSFQRPLFTDPVFVLAPVYFLSCVSLSSSIYRRS